MIFQAPRHAIDRLLLAASLLLWPPFLLLATRRSGSPSLFGLWSTRYAMVLAAYAAGLLLASYVAWAILRGGSGRLRIHALLGWLRRRPGLSWLVVIGPPLMWLLAVAALLKVGVVPTPAIVLCLMDAGLVIICCECAWALIGQPKKRQRELVLKFLLAGSATLMTLLASELLAAALGIGAYASWKINPQQLDVQFTTDDFDIRVVTNRQGLRESSDVPTRHPERQRIVVIGDSMTFGWGVEAEQAYARVAERTLHEKFGRTDLEIVNMGRPGAGPHDYLKYLRQYAVELRPDLIVIGLLVGNDCPVIPPADLTSDADVQAAFTRHLARADTTWFDRLAMKSFLVRLGYAGLSAPARITTTATDAAQGRRGPIFNEPNPLDPAQLHQEMAASADPDDTRQRYERLRADGWIDRGLAWQMNPWLIRAIILHPTGAADSLAVRPESFEAMQYEWKLCAELLGAAKVTTDRLGIPLVILAIPNAHLVSRRWVDFLEERGCEVNERMTSEQVVNQWLADFCRQADIRCVDPLATFRRQQTDGQHLYLETDDHMTPAGYALLGQALAEALHDELASRGSQP